MARIPIQTLNRSTAADAIPNRLYIGGPGFICDKETGKVAQLDLPGETEVVVMKREDFLRMFKVYSLRSLTLH